MLIGLVADLIGANRSLMEDMLVRLRRMELGDQGLHVERVATPAADLPRVQGGHS